MEKAKDIKLVILDVDGVMTDGTYFLWDPLAAALASGLPLGSFSAARVDVEEADGPEVGFTRPVDGTPNVEYLSSVDRVAVEVTLLDTLNSPIGPGGSTP